MKNLWTLKRETELNKVQNNIKVINKIINYLKVKMF